MKKSTLNLCAKLIQKLDAEMFGMTSGTIEHAIAQNARVSLLTVIEGDNYKLGLDYKLETDKVSNNAPAGDDALWAKATNDELYDIAKGWAKRFTIRKLRAFQEYYKNLQIKYYMKDEQMYMALEHRWQCVTWAIDYRAFEMKKAN